MVRQGQQREGFEPHFAQSGNELQLFIRPFDAQKPLITDCPEWVDESPMTFVLDEMVSSGFIHPLYGDWTKVSCSRSRAN